MLRKTLEEWLQWQENVNPFEIDLQLDRVKKLMSSLDINPPKGRVFTLAGTNGKGSCAAVISGVLRHNGYKTGTYTSPHLIKYNERISINGKPVSDIALTHAFERIEASRNDIPLTFFEFGTLAAWLIFQDSDCDAWVLEVGLGGRLDAVNAIDPDYALISTIGLDHQNWLGNTIEDIAAEKAGIIRPNKPVIFGDKPVPLAIRQQAKKNHSKLYSLDDHFTFKVKNDSWCWQGLDVELEEIQLPFPCSPAQLRNISASLAVLAAFDKNLILDKKLSGLLSKFVRLPGRFQIYRDSHLWVLDVAHNTQAAIELKAGLKLMCNESPTIILGMSADKDVSEFVNVLSDIAGQWIFSSIESTRGVCSKNLEDFLVNKTKDYVLTESIHEACDIARRITPVNGHILVCGSF
ncbi:MAG: folylpolyglutamate synthase/dihydrofolate synthase family protein, partial [Pseudomonadota bacterium]|nr:folylpolyglutamate synthase/dihydrofolate synthase family protein [Pseudomonadota bacterium]